MTSKLAATVNACVTNGIKKIGWHCVDSNVGSYTIAENVGFKKIKEYNSFTPYPPIENVTDLNDEQWSDWAMYYEEMNRIEPKYHMLAAECWAKANHVQNSIKNIQYLIDQGDTAFIEEYYEVEFENLKDNDQWINFKKELYIKYSIVL